MAKQIQITKPGLEALQKELDGLMGVKRPKLVERLAYARSQGDLSENNDYQSAKEELEFMDGRISELEDVLKNAQVIKSSGKTNGVGIGTKVTLKYNGSRHVFEIVGDWEADPANKKISHESPLGKALVGKRVGEKVKVEAPAGKVTYEILEIK
jgi:transcription elongation factor GreA